MNGATFDRENGSIPPSWIKLNIPFWYSPPVIGKENDRNETGRGLGSLHTKRRVVSPTRQPVFVVRRNADMVYFCRFSWYFFAEPFLSMVAAGRELGTTWKQRWSKPYEETF